MFNPETLDSLIRESGISFKENGVSFIFDCPRCSKSAKLWIRKRDGAFICWYCNDNNGFKGKAPRALAELMSMSVEEINRRLGTDAKPQAVEHLSLEIKDPYSADAYSPDPKALAAWDFEFIDILDPKALEGQVYLRSRGITLALAKHYQIKYSREHRRVIIPVIEFDQLYGWQARCVMNGMDRPKILTSSGLNKNHALMFHDNLINSPHAIICEGPFDALHCHNVGGAVATMGKIVSDEQVKMIQDLEIPKIYIALDPDAAPEITELSKKFSNREVYCLMPSSKYKDLGEMPLAEVEEAFHKAPRLDSYRIIDFL